MKISVQASAVARFLGIIAVILIILSVGGQLSRFLLGHGQLKGLVHLFCVDSERNIPTFFTVLLMLFVALLLAYIASSSMKHKMPHTWKWMILSFCFLFMAYDEAFIVHEKLIAPFRTLMGNDNYGIFYFAWVIPGTALVIIFGLFFLRFMLHLQAKTRLRFIYAAILYFGGAIGMELVGGWYFEKQGEQDLTYSMITTVEESLELAGLILFIWTILKYIPDHHKKLRVKFNM